MNKGQFRTVVRFGFWAATLVGVSGCGEDQTAILLHVCSNVPEGQAETAVVTIAGGGNEKSLRYDLEDVPLPIELSLRPGTEMTGAVEIGAFLQQGSEAVVTRRITTSFERGRDFDVRILLDASCIRVYCPGDSTCEKGECTSLGRGNDTCAPAEPRDGGQGDGDVPRNCDVDGDQYESVECGGNDCDDSEFATHPDAAEICDQIDNDCSNGADDGLWLLPERPPIYVSYAVTDEERPTIARGLAAYGVAWRATQATGTAVELRFVRLAMGQEGYVTPDVAEQVILSGVDPAVGASMLGWDGSGWAVLYEDLDAGLRSILFRRIDSSGLGVASPVVLSGFSDAQGPALVWTGMDWGAVWSESRGTYDGLQFARLSSDGSLDVTQQIPVGTACPSCGRIEWGDSRFAVAWIESAEGNQTVMLGLLSTDGDVQAGPTAVSEPNAPVGENLDLAWVGDGYALLWEQEEGGISQLYFARVDPTGEREAPPIAILSTGNRSVEPDMAFSGRELGVAWADGPLGDAKIMFQRVDTQGEPIGSPELMVHSGTTKGSRPAVAWNAVDGEYAIVWQDNRLEGDVDVWFNRYICEDGR